VIHDYVLFNGFVSDIVDWSLKLPSSEKYNLHAGNECIMVDGNHAK
jgi:hypothetical protein